MRNLLLQHGFNPVGAKLWSEFLNHVLVMFRQAEAALRQPQYWVEFKKKPGALGKEHALNSGGVSVRYPNEDAITTELGHLIMSLRRGLPLEHFLRVHEVEFHVERPVQDAVRAGRYSRKVDFFVQAASGPDAPVLAIEAKPIRKLSDIKNRYLARDGLGCFLETDSPYSSEHVAGMLGYSVAYPSRSWRNEIREAVQTGCYPANWSQLAVLKDEPAPALVSSHDRSKLSLNPVAIIHMEMRFDVDKNLDGLQRSQASSKNRGPWQQPFNTAWQGSEIHSGRDARHRLICDPLAGKRSRYLPCNPLRVGFKGAGVYGTVGIGVCRNTEHRNRFQPDAWYAKIFGVNERRSGSAEWVKQSVVAAYWPDSFSRCRFRGYVACKISAASGAPSSTPPRDLPASRST